MSTDPLANQLSCVEQYFRLLSAFETSAQAFASVLHPDVRHTEYPNAIVSQIQETDLTQMLQGAARGKALLANQSFTLERYHPHGDSLIVEGLWHGTVAVSRGKFSPGQVLTAWMCIVFEFKQGLIWRQRNYDCYEPF